MVIQMPSRTLSMRIIPSLRGSAGIIPGLKATCASCFASIAEMENNHHLHFLKERDPNFKVLMARAGRNSDCWAQSPASP